MCWWLNISAESFMSGLAGWFYGDLSFIIIYIFTSSFVGTYIRYFCLVLGIKFRTNDYLQSLVRYFCCGFWFFSKFLVYETQILFYFGRQSIFLDNSLIIVTRNHCFPVSNAFKTSFFSKLKIGTFGCWWYPQVRFKDRFKLYYWLMLDLNIRTC